MAPSITDDQAPVSGDGAADVAVLQAENATLQDRMLRALADAENTRRRADRTAQDARQYAIADFARELLVIVDNLQRAIQAAEASDQGGHDRTLIEGIRATQQMLMATLERFGVRPIAALHSRFDPMLHEAIMEVEDASHPPGTAIRVVEEGFTLQDRLLRPARVVVAKAPSRRPSSGDEHPGSSNGAPPNAQQ